MDLWEVFLKTGKVSDYLKYIEEKKKKDGKNNKRDNNPIDRL